MPAAYFSRNELDDKHQWLPELKDITRGVVSYEGLIAEDNYGNKALKGISLWGLVMVLAGTRPIP